MTLIGVRFAAFPDLTSRRRTALPLDLHPVQLPKRRAVEGAAQGRPRHARRDGLDIPLPEPAVERLPHAEVAHDGSIQAPMPGSELTPHVVQAANVRMDLRGRQGNDGSDMFRSLA